VLATVDNNGKSQVTSVDLRVDDDFNFTVMEKKRFPKSFEYSKNNKVDLVVGTTEGLNTAQIHGEVKILYPGDQNFSFRGLRRFEGKVFTQKKFSNRK
jgi:hypothetical protein